MAAVKIEYVNLDIFTLKENLRALSLFKSLDEVEWFIKKKNIILENDSIQRKVVGNTQWKPIMRESVCTVYLDDEFNVVDAEYRIDYEKVKCSRGYIFIETEVLLEEYGVEFSCVNKFYFYKGRIRNDREDNGAKIWIHGICDSIDTKSFPVLNFLDRPSGVFCQDGIKIDFDISSLIPFEMACYKCNLSGESRFELNITRSEVNQDVVLVKEWLKKYGRIIQ